MKITVISVAWNKYKLTKEFLQRLRDNTDIPFQLVFVDNGSEEPISKLVKEYFPHSDLITYKKNMGLPATRNPSMKKATGDIVIWLDNDTYVEKNWYKPFLAELDNPKVGVVGPEGRKIRNPFTYKDFEPWEHPVAFLPNPYVDWFVGYAMALRRKAYKPIPDWKLMVTFDDIDVCLGVKVNGYKAKMIINPVPLRHLGSQTATPVRPTQKTELELFPRWWEYWKPYKKYFENYG